MKFAALFEANENSGFGLRMGEGEE